MPRLYEPHPYYHPTPDQLRDIKNLLCHFICTCRYMLVIEDKPNCVAGRLIHPRRHGEFDVRQAATDLNWHLRDAERRYPRSFDLRGWPRYVCTGLEWLGELLDRQFRRWRWRTFDEEGRVRVAQKPRIDPDTGEWEEPVSMTPEELKAFMGVLAILKSFTITDNLPLPPETTDDAPKGTGELPSTNQGAPAVAGNTTASIAPQLPPPATPPEIKPADTGGGQSGLPPAPRWDGKARTLYDGDRACFRIRKDAKNLIDLFESFQDAGWMNLISDPFEDERKLWDTIKAFKENHADSPIVFSMRYPKVEWKPWSRQGPT